MSLSEYNVSVALAFLGGLVVGFSPCIYPLLPVFLGSISPYTQKSKFKGFFLSFTYISGFAFVYSLLGIISSLGGSVFGKIITYPLSRITAGVIFIIFGLSLLDIFSLKVISFRIPLKPLSFPYLKIFFMGLSSALVISPCVSPILGSILLYVAMKRKIFYGWLLLISFAYGMGFLLILCGTFSSLILSLPKSGRWTEKIKKISGLVLILSGLYFIIATLSGKF